MADSVKNLKNIISLKEKREFIARLYCHCGGEFQYNFSSASTDIFGSMFNAIQREKDQTVEKFKFAHKCCKCGLEQKFINQYPLIEKFEIGLYASNEDISAYVAKTFQEKMHDDLQEIGYNV